ncbi:hypothetical protein [Rhodohalobacter sp. 614A]|uniref:hypothetical protein n=1 Tax=Rhodohalobacter sp. 614A TaxID=2908649 RepID=UPI001F45DFFF|nr:hypothetical protein [Rhodohalobacter sp. 614A]
MLRKAISVILFLFLITTICSQKVNAQNQFSQSLFRMAEGFVRIAEPGQLSDTLSVWGDVNSPGRYIVPRNTKVHELVSYARGPIQSRIAGQNLDWSKLRLEISISRPQGNGQPDEVASYEFMYNDPYPVDLRNYHLGNDYIVSVEVKRKPAFVDWLRVVSSIVGTTATTIIIVDRLTE